MSLEEKINAKLIKNNEPLVKLANFKIKTASLNYLNIKENDLYAREKVAYKLMEVNKGLPENYELIVLDAFRTINQQKNRYEQKVKELKNQYEHLTEEQILKEASEYTENPTDIPTHTTGGAVDVSLLYKDKLVDMGCFYGTIDFRTKTDSSFLINSMQQKNRQILKNAMENQGFVNNPLKWWHYSYGDQAWANKHKTRPLYGKKSII